jgi:hypothetical protein
MTVRFIGDVHGKFNAYKRIISQCSGSIQVGDMGVGFKSLRGWDDHYLSNPPHYKMVAGNHRFIRGNHDNPGVCARHSQCIKDGTVENDVMFIGGAISIDKEYRVEGISWWPDEELSIQQLDALIDVYQVAKPRIMVTHDCPESIANAMCCIMNWKKFDFPSRTRQALQAMLELHKPEIWLFGHWHFSFDRVIDGVRFICLNELECKDIEI